jgi:hypothetical protein
MQQDRRGDRWKDCSGSERLQINRARAALRNKKEAPFVDVARKKGFPAGSSAFLRKRYSQCVDPRIKRVSAAPRRSMKANDIRRGR